MNIALFDPNWSGHHTIYNSLICKYFINNGHNVIYITLNDHKRLDEFPEETQVEYITNTQNPDSSSFSGFSKYLLHNHRQLKNVSNITQNSEVDILHLTYIDYSILPLFLASRDPNTNFPTIVGTIHKDRFTSGSPTSIAHSVYYSILKHILNYELRKGIISKVFVHSEKMRHRICSEIPSGSSENLSTIPAPTPSIHTELSSKEAKLKLGFSTDVPSILFFGIMNKNKSPDLLPQALEGTSFNLELVFAGPEGDFTSADVSRWKEQTPSNISIIDRTGFIPEDQIDIYFKAVDALVLPYERKRGISGPLRRACMANTHIIGPTKTDVGDIIEKHSLGQTFEYSSKFSLKSTIKEFLNNMEKYPKSGVEEYANRQHWEASGVKLESEFSQVV